MTKLYNMLLLDKVYRCQFCIVDLWCCWIQLFKLIYFNWRIITLQYCGVFFAIHQHESTTSAHVSHYPDTPSHLPPHSIPLNCPRAPTLSALLHALNLHWSSVSHMIIYMFQCYAVKSSHRCPLPHSPKVCSWHQCLFCCLAYRIIVTVFLKSMYMH